MRPLRILAVGKLRTPFWSAAADHYRTRLAKWRALTESIVRDADAALPQAERVARESRTLLASITPLDIPICLDEHGRCMTSLEFSRFLADVSADANRVPCFVIGGAFGYDDSVRAVARHLIAFGPLTLPHELARVILLEQLYRAEAILRNIPYHH